MNDQTSKVTASEWWKPRTPDIQLSREANWFIGNIPRWRALFKEHRPTRKPIRYLEIGSYEGRSTVWVLENVLTDPLDRAVIIEPGMLDDGECLKKLQHNMAQFPNDITIIRRNSDVLSDVDASFDIIYVDGMHTEGAVYLDGMNAYRMITPGGLLIFDDYGWDPNDCPKLSPDGSSPKTAIDRLLEEWGDSVELLYKKFQVWLRKR